ncbi:MAG: hypothetical protein U1E73_06830 [Planctomycetota bacterium]
MPARPHAPGLLLALALAACAPDAPRREPRQSPAPGPWAVNGIALGADEAACRQVLGDDCEEVRNPRVDLRSMLWRQHQFSITFDRQGRACQLWGDRLTTLDGKPLLVRGAEFDDVVEILPQAEREDHSRPTGSGVISIGRTYTGTSFTWSDENGDYVLGGDTHSIVSVYAISHDHAASLRPVWRK